MPRYNPNTIEPRWQQFWEEHRTFRTPDFPGEKKLYALDMFPYPSGDGLHVGHPEGYTATDIVCRYQRMKGVSVLHPMGFDAFGLPAEEHAIKTNTPPRESTERNIANFTRQLKMLGFSYDWDRVLATTDVEYFRWTQWIFLEIYDTWYDVEQRRGRPIAELPIPEDVAAKGASSVAAYRDEHRLAYQADALVNWCPALGTVLANEEVQDGKSERGDHPVQRLPLRQWMLRITAYADRLERDLESLDWSEGIKKLQRDWIGRSTGAEIDFFVGAQEDLPAWREARAQSGFPTKSDNQSLRVYTTRPDTLFGATYMVMAPEHPLVDRLTTPEQSQAISQYREATAAKSDRERTENTKDKTGAFTGSYAVNPANGAAIPIWIADYVLASYGSGAIMAVPAHDERDFEFAVKYSLPIVAVVEPPATIDIDRQALLAGQVCYAGKGKAMQSGDFDGGETDDVKGRLTEQLNREGCGAAAVNYKLRDWLFSRQRFWGEPFPILHELDAAGEPTGVKIADDQLPVDLPHLEDYKPHGRPEPPLANADDDWLIVERDGKRYRRETNTMPQWAGSCWYYLRYIDPRNDQAFVDPEKEKAWMPVDLYVGGAEHAVLHLLYARFWHKVLYDRGHVNTLEPFQKLVNQGMILGDIEYTGYQDASGEWVSAADVSKRDTAPVVLDREQVEKSGESFVLKGRPEIRVDSRAHKMSKSRGNVVNPDDIVRDYGADSLRLYEMFMGPLEATKPWSMEGVNGVRNFLDRAWRMIIDESADEMRLHSAVQEIEPTSEQNRVLHKTIGAVSRSLDRMEFNTAIARMMEFVNFFTRETARPKSIMRSFVLLLSPYAPHLAEELWRSLGGAESLAYEPWPEYIEDLAKDESVEIPVQILGKLRAKIVAPADADRDSLEQLALGDERVRELLEGKQIVKTVVVPGRLVNFVVK